MASPIDKLEIRDMKISELNEASRFHKEYYGDIRPVKVWHWEYDTFNSDKSVIVLVRDEGKIVGTQGMIPLNLNIAGKVYLTGKSEGTLLSSEYRGTGLYSKYYTFAIERCREKGMACLWGYTSLLGAFSRVNYTAFEKMMKLSIMPLSYRSTIDKAEKLLDKQSAVKKLFTKAALWLSVKASALKRAGKLNVDHKLLDEYDIHEKPLSSDDLPLMFSTIRKDHPDLIHLHMDEQYLDWRIFNIPVNTHLTYFIYNDSKLVGYLLAAIREDTAELTDFMYIDEKAGLLLLKMALGKMLKMEKGMVTYSGNCKNALNIKILNLLKPFGFFQKDRLNDFIVQNLSYPDEQKLTDIKNWYLTDLWSEGI